VHDFKAHRAVAALVEVRVGGEKGALLGFPERRHAVERNGGRVRSTWVMPSRFTSAKSCCTESPAWVVRSSAERK